LGKRVRDSLEQVVEAVLGEDVVEDVRELAIRLDERVRAWGFRDGGFAVRCMRRRNSRKVMPHRHSFSFVRAREIPRKGELSGEQKAAIEAASRARPPIASSGCTACSGRDRAPGGAWPPHFLLVG
jgi:hypothetical protein